MSVQITSTTDSDKDVLAAMGKAMPKESVKEEKSAPDSEKSDDQVETKEESDTSKTDLDESEGDDTEESDDSDEAKSEEDKKPKKKKGFEKRLNKLNKRLSAKDQEVEYWKQEALKGKSSQEHQPKEAPKKEIQPNGEPDPDKFDSHAEYVKAVSKWAIQQDRSEQETKQKENQVKTDYQKQVTAFQTKVTEFQKSHEDFDDVIAAADDIPISVGVQEAILSSDVGPDLMYELCNNREEYKRINALSPLAAAREIGKIEARILKSSESEKPEKKQTNAPPPIKPVGSKGSGKSMKSPDEMSFQEYKAWRAENK